MPFLAEVKSIFNNLISFRSPHKKSHSGSKRKRDEIIADAEVDQPAAQSLVPPGLDSDQQLTHFFGPSSNANKATLQPYSSSAPGVISQPAISAFNLSSDVLPHSNYQFKNFQPPGSVLSDRAPPSGMKGEDYKFHRRMHTKVINQELSLLVLLLTHRLKLGAHAEAFERICAGLRKDPGLAWSRAPASSKV